MEIAAWYTVLLRASYLFSGKSNSGALLPAAAARKRSPCRPLAACSEHQSSLAAEGGSSARRSVCLTSYLEAFGTSLGLKRSHFPSTTLEYCFSLQGLDLTAKQAALPECSKKLTLVVIAVS